MFIIAEIAQAHDGSLGMAHAYIDALAQAGIDAVKFQTHIAAAESSEHEPFRVNFSYEDKTRYDYWERMEFTEEQWIGLKKHCDELGVEFMSSPFSIMAVDLLERIGVKRYKVGSGEVSNFLLLDRIAKTGKPVILSSGMSSFDELENSIEFLAGYDTDISILQCTTAYPTSAENWGLNVISELKERYGKTVGFSDHSGNVFASFAATSLGAEILEFHAVFDHQMFGPDASSSLNMKQISQLVIGSREIFDSLQYSINKNDLDQFGDLKLMFEKSLAVNRDLPVGHALQIEDLESKKPSGFGISASRFRDIIGKTLKTEMSKWQFLKEENLNND